MNIGRTRHTNQGFKLWTNILVTLLKMDGHKTVEIISGPILYIIQCRLHR